ncbi:hypothetical protein MRX96_050877 [Rhipicephalus microplus]
MRRLECQHGCDHVRSSTPALGEARGAQVVGHPTLAALSLRRQRHEAARTALSDMGAQAAPDKRAGGRSRCGGNNSLRSTAAGHECSAAPLDDAAATW